MKYNFINFKNNLNNYYCIINSYFMNLNSIHLNKFNKLHCFNKFYINFYKVDKFTHYNKTIMDMYQNKYFKVLFNCYYM